MQGADKRGKWWLAYTEASRMLIIISVPISVPSIVNLPGGRPEFTRGGVSVAGSILYWLTKLMIRGADISRQWPGHRLS